MDERLKQIDEAGGVLLISCYELGHQPLGLVVPAAHLKRAGFSPSLLDIAVDALDDDALQSARLVAISAPMHTALRLGVEVAQRVRTLNPAAHICFYGIYAELNAEELVGGVADSCLGAEFVDNLVGLAESMRHPHRSAKTRASTRGLLPDRTGLPGLDRYVRLLRGGAYSRVGYVASTRGCKHTCLHCPLTPVYRGRFYAIAVDDVVADAAQLVALGASHITFGDPDFLNGPTHALRVARALHERFQHLTFDYTAKIDHLDQYRDVVAELQSLGCIFVVSAIESFDDDTLIALDKGHTAAQAVDVIRLFRSLELTLRPSFVPFTPWTTLDDYLNLLDTVRREDMIDSVDPIQFTIRLLLPHGSALERADGVQPFLTGFDRMRFTHTWCHPDPRMDDLQRSIHAAVERATEDEEDSFAIFARVEDLARLAGGGPGAANKDPEVRDRPNRPQPPRLTEDWFC